MNHLDLFSGIGGFALAAREVWKDEYNPIGFCDNDYFCQQVLAKNFPGIPIYEDIRTLTNTDPRFKQSDKEVQTGGKTIINVDLITGGFPCQPFSAAGQKRGTEDDRYLWPEMLRVIKEFKPTWIIGENVAGIIHMALNQVCTDLEAEGYEVQSLIIPAVALNAPHRRDRVWIIAYNPSSEGLQGKSGREKTHTECPRLGGDEEWNKNWIEVASTLCRVDDGLSKRMVRLPDGRTISYPRWRRESLKAYGNAIVPQVAVEIMKTIRGVSLN